MLWSVAVVLIVLWMLGLFTAYTMGGAVHVLLAIAIVAIVFKIYMARRRGGQIQIEPITGMIQGGTSEKDISGIEPAGIDSRARSNEPPGA